MPVNAPDFDFDLQPDEEQKSESGGSFRNSDLQSRGAQTFDEVLRSSSSNLKSSDSDSSPSPIKGRNSNLVLVSDTQSK